MGIFWGVWFFTSRHLCLPSAPTVLLPSPFTCCTSFPKHASTIYEKLWGLDLRNGGLLLQGIGQRFRMLPGSEVRQESAEEDGTSPWGGMALWQGLLWWYDAWRAVSAILVVIFYGWECFTSWASWACLWCFWIWKGKIDLQNSFKQSMNAILWVEDRW